MRWLIGLLLVCNVCFAQDSTLVIDTKPITQREVYNDIKGVVKSLADGLTTTSEHVYNALIKQAIAKGVTSLIFELIPIIFGIIWAIKLSKITKWAAEYDKEERTDLGQLVVWIPTVFLSIGIVIALIYMPNSITQVISPEYYAIKQVLSLLNPNGCN